MKLSSSLAMSHQLLLPILQKARTIVDATAGNGKDTLFLASHAPKCSKIWVFDVQPQALNNTRRLLDSYGIQMPITYILDSHSHIERYISQPIDVITFNLGYLPGGDHGIFTQSFTTLSALEKCCHLLAPGGFITIVAYPGHPAGLEEAHSVESFLQSLNQRYYTVGCWQMINQKNHPPVLYVLTKKEGSS